MQFYLDLARRFGADKSGSNAVEYALLAGLMSALIVAALISVGSRLTANFSGVSGALN